MENLRLFNKGTDDRRQRWMKHPISRRPKRALLALKITAVNVGFWVTPGCWRDDVLGGWTYGGGYGGVAPLSETQS